MVDWRFAEALEADTHGAVTRWWACRRPVAAAPIPDGLVDDLQAARLALDDGLQRRLSDLATILPEPQRSGLTKRIAELDPWHVLSEMAAGRAQPDPAAAERQAADDDGELIVALKERARRRERLEHPRFPSKARRLLRDFVRRRGSLAAVLEDDDACLMLRFGAVLCELIEVDLGVQAEPDPVEVCAELGKLSEADIRRAAEALVVNGKDRDHLPEPERDASKVALAVVTSDARGRPSEPEITDFVQAVMGAVERRVGHRYRTTIARLTAGSPDWDDVPGPDIQLILDLLACHAPLKKSDAVANLIKKARASSRRE